MRGSAPRRRRGRERLLCHPYHLLRTRWPAGYDRRIPSRAVTVSVSTTTLDRRHVEDDTVHARFARDARDGSHDDRMIFAPYLENSMVGGNGFGSPLPQVSD